MSPAERQALLEQALRGDADASGRLLESYRPLIRLMVRTRLHTRLQAKVGESDLIQDAMLELHRSFGSFTGKSVEDLVNWLRAVVHNAVNHTMERFVGTAKRDLSREVAGQDFEQIPADSDWSPEKNAIKNDDVARMAAALELLPDDMRQVLLGRHQDDLSYDELAHRLNKSPGAVRVLYSRAVRRLREACRNEDSS